MCSSRGLDGSGQRRELQNACGRQHLNCTVARQTYSFYTHHSIQFITHSVKRRSRHATGAHEELQKPEAMVEYNGWCRSGRPAAVILWHFPSYCQTVEAGIFYLLDAAMQDSAGMAHTT